MTLTQTITRSYEEHLHLTVRLPWIHCALGTRALSLGCARSTLVDSSAPAVVVLIIKSWRAGTNHSVYYVYTWDMILGKRVIPAEIVLV